ncbi:MAG: hypothetical protein II632_05050, partial [Bacteroidales bacterium]|nr:hypothetical protein [Bacteroidales bacterium]
LRPYLKETTGSYTDSVVMRGTKVIGWFKGKLTASGAKVEDFQGEDRYESNRPGKVLLEANYKTPAFGSGDTALKMQEGGCQYVPGRRWHLYQALTGYSLMTGEQPDFSAMLKESLNG